MWRLKNKMSYTPIFVVRKEEFDKHFDKISGVLSAHSYGLSNFYDRKKELVKKEKERLNKNIGEIGVSVDSKVIEKKAQEIIEKSNNYLELSEEMEKTQHPLGDIMNYHSEEEFVQVGNEKYYVFNTEYSSQAQAIKDFCEENKIPYGTTY